MIQKKCGLEPRILPLLGRQLFQLVVDAHAISVVAQHSDYAVRVDGTPDNLALRRGMVMNGLDISNVNYAGLMGDVDAGVTYDAVSHDILLTSRV